MGTIGFDQETKRSRATHLALSLYGTIKDRYWMCELGEGFSREEKETHEFALKTGIGEPFDTNTVTDLHRRVLGVFANSDDITNTFVTTDERT